jgi:hypothetical protein
VNGDLEFQLFRARHWPHLVQAEQARLPTRGVLLGDDFEPIAQRELPPPPEPQPEPSLFARLFRRDEHAAGVPVF